MNKRVFLFFIFLVFYGNCFGQSDSLSFYYEKKDFRKAINYCEKIRFQFTKEDIKANKDNYVNILLWLITLNEEIKDYENTEKYYLQVLGVLNNESKDYFIMQGRLARFYIWHNKRAKAEKLLIDNYERGKKLIGETNPDYFTMMADLAFYYDDIGDYSKAEKIYLELIEIEKNVLGEDNQQFAITLINFSDNYISKKKYDEAEKLLKQALIITKRNIGENQPNYASAISLLGRINLKKGNYIEAKKYYFQSNAIFESISKTNDPYYFENLSRLANIYYLEEYYFESEIFYLNALKIGKDVIGENNDRYINCLLGLSDLYVALGDLDKAEKIAKQIIEFKKIEYGENDSGYARAIWSLGYIYEKKKDFNNARLNYLKAIEIEKKILGENDSNYVISLYSLARIYEITGNFSEAEILYKQVIQLRKKIFGEYHSDYLQALSALGTLYASYNYYDKAEKLYLESIKFGEIDSNIYNYRTDTRLNNLSVLYFKWDKPKLAAVYFEKYFKPFHNQIYEASNFLSENQLRLFSLDKFSNRFLPLSFLNHYPNQFENINIGCYENELLVKNISLRNQQRISKSIQKRGDIELQNKYEQFINNKRQLTKISELPIDKRPTNYEQLNNETEILEKDLVRQSSAFADTKKSLSITWKAVKEKLQPNEIAIDLVTYQYYNKKWTDSIVYAAFVVKKGFKYPKYIPLFEQKQLDFLLAGNDEMKSKDKIDKQYTDKAIGDLFLKPLQQELEGISTIYLSPSGLGHQIDFSALPVSEPQTLGEKYKVHILGSTAEIVNYKVTSLDKKSNLELLLYGGIDYNKSAAVNKTDSEPIENNNNAEFVTLTTRSGISKWNYLEGTKKEIDQIKISSQQNGFESTLIKGDLATEESIKELDGRTAPYVMHIATHGFFFPDPIQELPEEKLQIISETKKSKIYKTSDDPMMRSGLLFAGANKYWGKTVENIITDDGILTANEISNLDLSACQLVVLSACETGLGEINGSEGVFGLQRAFKMAGVKNIIMSLWKVPDVQTAELFDIFYSECFTGKNIHDAFQTAQSKMKAKYSPYYWAGFVLLE